MRTASLGSVRPHAEEERAGLARLRLDPDRARMRQRELAALEETASGALRSRRVPDEGRLEDHLSERLRNQRAIVHHEEEEQRLALVLHPAQPDDDLAA